MTKSDSKIRRIGVLTSGGDAPGMNAAVRAVVRTALARVTVLGHIQRGGSPMARDRETATRMGYAAVKALDEGRENVVIGTKEGRLVEIPIEEALTMKKELQMDRYHVMETMHNLAETPERDY